MTIATLKPIQVRPKRITTPQCCVPVDPPTHDQEWRRRRHLKNHPQFDPDRCQRESTLTIGSQPYCRLHAGQLALEKWLLGELQEA